ncbi:MAG TPA: energy transducer TonB [Aeromonadales bacterium]|nr:energy transducer TonB [Aeromonadales bacterium]
MNPDKRKFIMSLSFTVCLFIPSILLAKEDSLSKNNPVEGINLVVMKTVPPYYPRKAVIEGIEGHVVFKFETDANGHAQNVKIMESVPGRIFDRSALRAIYQWEFKPKNTKNLIYTMKFKLEK